MAANSHCPECGVFVKPENLPSHLRKAHGKGEEATRLERRNPGLRSRGRSGNFPLWVILVVALVTGLVAAGAFLAYQYAPPPNEPPLNEMCVQHSGLGIHNHAQLAITILGSPYTIPANVGIVSSTCYRPLHTHDTSGTIHIELPRPRTVHLSDFFAIWGQTFSRNQVLSYATDAGHEIVMSVGGVPSGAYENLVLLDGQSVSIQYRAL